MKFRKKRQKDKKAPRKVYLDDSEDDNEDEDGGYYVDDDSEDDYDSDDNEIKAYSDAREEHRQKRKLRKKRVVFLVLFVFLAAFACLNWSSLAPAGLSETVQGFFSSFGKSKYPVYFDEGTMKATVQIGSNIGVLTDTSFLVYSQNGDQLASRPHGFNNPAAVSGGGKALIYDRGGKSFRVETRFDEPFKSTALYDITAAAMGQNGDFAIVTDADNYLSELTVYDNSYKNIFKWDSTQGRILTAALSPDGRMLVAIVIGTRNGSMFSDIYIFNLGQNTPVAVKKYDSELLTSVKFKDNGRIAAVGDSKAVFLSASGEQLSCYSYGNNELTCSSNGDGPLTLVFKQSGTKSTVLSLDSNGNILGKASLAAANVGFVTNSDGSIVVISSGQIWHATEKCENARRVAVSGDMLSAVSMKGYAYIFGTQSIARYKLS